MKFAFLAPIVGARRTDPNTATKSRKLGKVIFLVEGKGDRGRRFTSRRKCILHFKMMVEGIRPEFEVNVITDQEGTDAFRSSAVDTFSWTILFAVIGTGGTNIKTTFVNMLQRDGHGANSPPWSKWT